MRGLKSLAAAVVGIAAITAAGTANAQLLTGSVWVGEFGGQIHQFSYTNGGSGKLMDNPAEIAAPFNADASYAQVEGLEGRGNDLVFAGVRNGVRGIYSMPKTGGTATNQSGGAHIAGGAIFDIKLGGGGSSYYFTQNNFDGAGNHRIGTGAYGAAPSTLISFAGANPWGLAIAGNGDLWYTRGFDGNATGAGVYNYTTNTQIDSTVGATGLAFDAATGDLFVVYGGNSAGSGPGVPSFIRRYFSGTGFTTSFDFGAGTITDAFDGEFGPDGSFYVTSEEGACVVGYDVNGLYSAAYTDKVFIHAPGPGNPNNSLNGAKTIHFDTNSVVPEPGTVAMFAGMAVAGAGVLFRRRK